MSERKRDEDRRPSEVRASTHGVSRSDTTTSSVSLPEFSWTVTAMPCERPWWPTHETNDELPEMLTPDDVASYLRLPRSTVYALLRRREIPAAFIGRRYRIRRDDLLGLFHRQPVAPAAAGRSVPSSVLPVFPDRVPPLGRPGRPRKVRRRWRGDSAGTGGAAASK